MSAKSAEEGGGVGFAASETTQKKSFFRKDPFCRFEKEPLPNSEGFYGMEIHEIWEKGALQLRKLAPKSEKALIPFRKFRPELEKGVLQLQKFPPESEIVSLQLWKNTVLKKSRSCRPGNFANS